MTKLIDRLVFAKSQAKGYQSRYRVVWEDPWNLDAPVKVTAPDPNFMAAAMIGGILPPVEAFHQVEYDNQGSPTNYHVVHQATPVGPMTEEEAIEYLIMKDLPRRVWETGHGNRRYFIICTVDQLPKTRQFRNAWRLSS